MKHIITKNMVTKNWLVLLVILLCILVQVNGMNNEQSAKISKDLSYQVKPHEWKIIFEFMGVMETFSRLVLVNKEIHQTINNILIQMNPKQIFRRVPDTIKLYLVYAYANHLSILDDAHLLPLWNQLDIETNLSVLHRPLELEPGYKNIISIFRELCNYNLQNQCLTTWQQGFTGRWEKFPMFFHFQFRTLNYDVWYRIDDLLNFDLFNPLFKYKLVFNNIRHGMPHDAEYVGFTMLDSKPTYKVVLINTDSNIFVANDEFYINNVANFKGDEVQVTFSDIMVEIIIIQKK